MAITLSLAGVSTLDPLAIAPPEPGFSNPLGGADGYTWSAQQEEQERLKRQARDARLEKIDSAILDPAGFFKKNPFSPSFAEDPEKARRRALVSLYLRHENDGQPLPMGADGHELMRRRVAATRFSGRGADDDDAFLAEVTKTAQGRKDRKAIAGKLMEDAAARAVIAAAEPDSPAGQWAPLRETLRSMPGWDATTEPDYHEAFLTINRETRAAMENYAEPLKSVWSAFKTKGDTSQAALAAYEKLDPEDRPRFMAGLALLARALPENERPAFLANLKKQAGRDVSNLASSTLDYVGTNSAIFEQVSKDARDPLRVPSPEEMAYFEARRADDKQHRLKVDFLADVRSIEENTFDPVKTFAADGSWTAALERGAYAAPGALASTAAAAIPGIGMPAFYASSREMAYQQFRQSFQAEGLSYDDASRYADTLAPIAAVPQVLAERLQIRAISGKLPILEKAIQSMEEKIKSKAATFATRAAVGAVEEAALEQTQNLIPSAVQDIAHALQSEIPDVNWTDGENGVLDGFWKDSAGMLVTMLPLAVLGAGVGTFKAARRISAASQATDDQLLALGASPEAVSNFRMADGMGAQEQALDSMVSTLDPTGETAKAATARVSEDIQRRQRAQQDLEALGYSSPRLVQTSEGISVFDSATGEELGTAPDLSGAMRIVQSHSAMLDDLEADQVAYLGTIMESARAAAELDPNAAMDMRLFERFDPDQATPEMAARFAAQVALKEQAEGGTGDIARFVLGYSQTEFAGNLRTTINRLFSDSSVTDVFHETFHGLRRGAHAKGLISRADEIALLRGLDQVMGSRRTKDGTALRFIPEGITDDQVSDTLLDEAISEIAEMEVLRTRKGKGKSKLGITRGIVSRNITALARLIPGVAGKWQAFIRAVRARWGLSLSRAAAMKKAEREGKFDRATYDAFLNKLLGLDEQAAHQDGMRAELNRILAMPEFDPTDDIPFSIGRSTITPSASTRVFQGAEGSPSVIGPAAFSISAWHGTPHKVDKFSLDKIGTGEGAQAYGWGLYFAAREAIARFYKENLSKGYRYDGKPYDAHDRNGKSLIERWMRAKRDNIPFEEFKKQTAEDVHNTVIVARHNLAEAQKNLGKTTRLDGWGELSDYTWTDDDLARSQESHDNSVKLAAMVDALKEEDFQLNEGNLYRVELNVEEDELLDWDKPLSEQSEKVREFFRDSGINAGTINEDGRKLYERAARRAYQNKYGERLDPMENPFQAMGDNGAATSEFLASAGIRGIRYLDGNSRADGKGSYNYVIFDESAIRITEENGQPVNLSTLNPQPSTSFSITPAQVPAMMAENALSRIADPRRKRQIMSRIARDFDAIRQSMDRMLALSGRRRSKAELRQMAREREDLNAELAIEQIHARYGELMYDEDLTKIKQQPVHAYLADPNSRLRGKLLSKSQAIKRHGDEYLFNRAGHYNGSDNVSRSVFGGRTHPADAAQNLYDEGLISEPTTDAMWEELLKEQNSVARMREAMAKAQEEIRAAKATAKEEATAWLNTQAKDQEANFSQKEEILRGLRMLDAILMALPAEVRGLIGGYTQMARITTDEARLSYLKHKLAKADKELEIYLRREFGNEMEAILKKAAPAKNAPGERPTGSIDADVYDIFRQAEAAMSLNFATAEKLADSFDATADDPETKLAEQEKARITAQMIRLMMNWTTADAARREQAVIEADRLYYIGLAGLRVKASERSARLRNLQSSAITGTGKAGSRMERIKAATSEKGTKIGALKSLAWEFLSFPQLVNALFGEKSAAAKWFRERELAASNALEDGYQIKANALESMFETLTRSRFDGVKLRHRMQTERRITATDALGNKHSFTDAEAITFLLMWRQEDGRRHMQGITDDETGRIVSTWTWDDKAAAAIESQLSPEAASMMAFLGSSYGTEYDRINDVFRRIWNVSMPRHKLYAPLTVKPVQGKADTIADPITGDIMGAMMTPGALKNRSSTAVAEPDFQDAFQVYLSHARQMEHFIAYGEFARDALAIVNRRDARNAIEAVSPEAAKTLSKWLDYFARGGFQNAAATGAPARILGNVLSRISQAALVGRVSVLAMQTLQLGAAAYKMPLGAYLSRLARLSAGRLQWSDALRSDYIQRRMETMPPAVRDAVKGLESGSPNRLKYLAARAGESMNLADGIFTAGTYAILYDYHLAQAKKAGDPTPEKTAHALAEAITDEIAQPTRPGAKSMLEISNAGNPSFRVLFNFASDPRQKLSLIVYQMMRADTKAGQKALLAGRALAITWMVSGIAQAVLRSILRDMRDDEDDEVFDERHWSLSRLALQAATGPVGGMPYFGDMIENTTYAATGQYMPQGGMLAGPQEAAKLPRKWMKRDFEITRDLETLFTGGATASGTSAAAASLMHAVRDAVGIAENFIPD